MAARVGAAADHARRGRAHPRPRGEPRRVDRRGGPGHARLLRVPRRADGRRGSPPRGHAPRLQGDRRGAVRGRAREGGVRDRDAVARHQHAGQDGGDRGPVEVPGRAARAPHARGVHAARPGAPAGEGSTSSVTPSWCTSGRCRSNGWRGSRRPGRTTWTRRSGRRTTWRSTWSATTRREQAHQLLNSSFAQFLADRGVVALERQRERDRESLAGYRTNLACDLGDFEEYWGLLREGEAAPGGRPPRPRAGNACEAIRRCVAGAATGRGHPRPADATARARRGAVVPGRQADGALGGPVVLPALRQGLRRSAHRADPDRAPAVGERTQRAGTAATSRRSWCRCTSSAHASPGTPADPEVEQKAKAFEGAPPSTPVPRAPSARSTSGGPSARTTLEAQLKGVQRRIQIRTETLARQFDRVLAVLQALGYVDDWTITPKGRTLARIYGEGDLLVGESLSVGAVRRSLTPGSSRRW